MPNEIKTLVNVLIDWDTGNPSAIQNQRRNGVGYVNSVDLVNKTYGIKLVPTSEPKLFSVETNDAFFVVPEISNNEETNYKSIGNQVSVINTLSGAQLILPTMFNGSIDSIYLNAKKITFNKGTKGEWLKLSKIYQSINQLETFINTHTHPVTSGGGVTGTIQPTDIITPLTQKSDLENKFILQSKQDE